MALLRHACLRDPFRRWLAIVLLALSGCASLPDRASIHAPASFALVAPAEARLAVTAREAVARAGERSAFKLMPVASASYETLLELAAQARQTLDLQTFELQGDASGALLLRTLRDAAARGVRVRVLIDDLHTDSAEALLSDLAAFDRIEVRLINPFVRLRGSRESKLVSSLDEFRRVNHRMHNKLFIADNALAVIGGRNIGDAYFMRAWEGENFIDLDALAAGAVVDDMSASFDAYWNSEFAWPIDAIVDAAADRGARRADFDLAVAPLAMPLPDYGIPERLLGYALVPDELRKGVLHMTGAQADVVVDPVDKLASSRVDSREGTVRAYIAREALDSALEVLTISPYYIPGNIGIESIREQRRSGIRMRVLTNSLAATDEPVVHAGYAEYRRDLVESGVELFELSPALTRQDQRLGRFGTAQTALHMKAMVFDQWALFLGSMNLDGRSERYNTEVGVMIRSTTLARELLWLVDVESIAWRVELGPDRRLRWVSRRGGREVVHDVEPEADTWRKLSSKILGLLIPHDWL